MLLLAINVYYLFFSQPDPCGSSPCLNGGTCRNNTDSTDYECECIPEACLCAESGKNCESK